MALLLSASEALVVLNLLIPSATGIVGTVPVTVSAELAISTTSRAPASVTERVDVNVGTRTPVRLRLASGVWTVKIVADELWTPSITVRPTLESRETRDVRLYRTALVTAPLAGLPSERVSVLVDFQDAANRKEDERVPEGSVDCPVSAGQLRCTVPTGLLDLRFEARGFVPEYRWSRTVIAGKTSPLPRLVFTPGASVSGYVRSADGHPAVDTTVELSTSSGDSIRPSNSGTQRRGAARSATTLSAMTLHTTALRAMTKERGFFRDGDWPVTVEASTPPVARTIARVPVAADASGNADVTIELPDTRLRGRVIDEAGLPARAFVKVLPDGGADHPFQLLAEPPDAAFVARGLPAGELQVEADAEFGRRSDPVVLELSEGEEREVALIVKGGRKVKGQMLSPEGTPVAGASILAFEDDLRSSSSRHIADTAGQFELTLRPTTRQLILAYWADGYATRLSTVPVSPEPLLLALERQGGLLTLDFGRELDLFDLAAPFQGVVSTGGVAIPVTLLTQVALTRRSLAEPPAARMIRALSFQQMNSGPYVFCVQDRDALVRGGSLVSSRCVEGVVQPGGETRLSLSPEIWGASGGR